MQRVRRGFLKTLEAKGSGVKPLYSVAAPAHILHLALASLSSSLYPQLLRHLSNRKLVISHHSLDLRDGAQEKPQHLEQGIAQA